LRRAVLVAVVYRLAAAGLVVLDVARGASPDIVSAAAGDARLGAGLLRARPGCSEHVPFDLSAAAAAASVETLDACAAAARVSVASFCGKAIAALSTAGLGRRLSASATRRPETAVHVLSETSRVYS